MIYVYSLISIFHIILYNLLVKFIRIDVAKNYQQCCTSNPKVWHSSSTKIYYPLKSTTHPLKEASPPESPPVSPSLIPVPRNKVLAGEMSRKWRKCTELPHHS